ncbi:MAG: diguanylate cyclase [Methylococcaceae bacterium]|nr:diguanylate cyclase [Methylococcaceae bacterium]
MNHHNRTAIGFIVIIILIAGLGIFSVQSIQKITKATSHLYEESDVISENATLIKMNIIAMHRSMKDVALSNSVNELEQAVSKVSQRESMILTSFRIIQGIREGSSQQIYQLYDDFVAWREIRNEVIALQRANKREQAANITKEKGAQYVAQLLSDTENFVQTTKKKADDVYDKLQSNTNLAIDILIYLKISVVLIIGVIAIYNIRRLKLSDKEIKNRNHLIDQNIMTAQLDVNGHITSISNALCRYFEVLKNDFINQPSHFFLFGDDIEEQEETIWRQLKSGSKWGGDIKHIKQNGSVQWADLRIIPEFDSNYKITGYSCIFQDLTSKKESRIDKLTKLGNRRQFEEIVDREVTFSQRHGTSLTLAIMDIDFFKKYNDHYGHPAGDETLTAVGDAILSSLRRPSDYAFRIGGEEFAVLLSDVDLDTSRNFLDDIRTKVEALRIPHADSDVSEFVTISIGGVSKVSDQGEGRENIYIEADKTLYLAKENRNQVVMSS